MSRRLAPVMVLLAALASPMARAQTNIDQGQSPAQIYASDCAVCHKTTRGLANGRGSAALTGFLSEHYTSSGREAAALAAYVLSGGGGIGTPAPVRPQKPESNHASADEPKAHDTRKPAKPEDRPTATAKLQEPSGDAAKPDGERSPVGEPDHAGAAKKPPTPKHEAVPTTRTRGRTKPADVASSPPEPTAEPTTVMASPSRTEPPSADGEPQAALDGQPTDATPVPRDNIPD